jgi:ribosomal subunit interface protein
VDVVVTGRRTTVSDRFRDHIEDKIEKVNQLAPRAHRVDVLISHEPNRRQSKACERIEITCHAKGPVIRAEACHEDKYAALDVALDKLLERLRRAQDKKKVHRGRRTPESVAAATARQAQNGSTPDSGADDEHESFDDEPFGAVGNSPIQVREKVHASRPMTLAEALHMMELVGHDFYLYVDSDTEKPSVVYRRRGWSYGVIHLDVTASANPPLDADASQSVLPGDVIGTTDDVAEAS